MAKIHHYEFGFVSDSFRGYQDMYCPLTKSRNVIEMRKMEFHNTTINYIQYKMKWCTRNLYCQHHTLTPNKTEPVARTSSFFLFN